MSYEEKGVWVYLVAALGTLGIYASLLLDRADGRPVEQVPYISTMLWMIGVSVVLTIAGRILFEIARPSESTITDPRDKEINRFGDWVGGFVLAIAVAGVLALVMLEVDHFWIAQAIYVAFVLQAVVSSVVKLGAYRFGL